MLVRYTYSSMVVHLFEHNNLLVGEKYRYFITRSLKLKIAYQNRYFFNCISHSVIKPFMLTINKKTCSFQMPSLVLKIQPSISLSITATKQNQWQVAVKSLHASNVVDEFTSDTKILLTIWTRK